jgi:hypothetical protein
VPNSKDMDFIARNFIPDDIGINESPLTEVVANRSASLRKVLQTVAGLNKASGHASGGFGIELCDIAANAE